MRGIVFERRRVLLKGMERRRGFGMWGGRGRRVIVVGSLKEGVLKGWLGRLKGEKWGELW